MYMGDNIQPLVVTSGIFLSRYYCNHNVMNQITKIALLRAVTPCILVHRLEHFRGIIKRSSSLAIPH